MAGDARNEHAKEKIIDLKMIKLLRKICFLQLFILLALTEMVYAQGGWNINYGPLNMVDSSFIGKEVRFDFKQSGIDTLLSSTISKINVRELLHRQDSVELNVAGKKINFIERWEFYSDQGFVQDQYLESFGSSGTTPFKIEKMILKKISNKFIYVEADFIQDGNILKVEIELSKKVIKGVLVKN